MSIRQATENDITQGYCKDTKCAYDIYKKDYIDKIVEETNAEIINRTNVDANLQTQINSLASGSPLSATTIDEMIDTTRIYVNTTDGNWYYHNGTSWISGGVYQSTGIADSSVSINSLNNPLKSCVMENKEYLFQLDLVNGVNCTQDFDFIAKKGQLIKLELIDNNNIVTGRIGFSVYNNGEINSGVAYYPYRPYYKFTNDCEKISFNVSSKYFSGTGSVTIKLSVVESIDFERILSDYKYIVPCIPNNSGHVNFTKYCFIPKETKIKINVVNDGMFAENSYYKIGVGYRNLGLINAYYQNSIKTDGYITLEDDLDFITCYMDSSYISDNTKNATFIIEVLENGIIYEIQKLKKQTVINNNRNRIVSILGDSYSSYEGWIPSNYYAYYGTDENETNVNDVSQTYWYKLIKDLNMNLLVNCSYTGSTVCNTGYSGNDYSDKSFITRMKIWLGEERTTETKPNLIIICGGTNDSWADSPIGSLKYDSWTEEDLKQFLPAFCYMLDYIIKYNPGAEIINLTNYLIKDEMKTGMLNACEHYGVTNINLPNIGNGHPNISGMETIYNVILEELQK